MRFSGSGAWKRVYVWREQLAVFFFFALLTVLLTYPAAFHLSDRVIGAGRGDSFHYLWQMWYPAHAVFDLHTSPFFDPDVYVPYGFDLIRNEDLSPANVLLLMPVTQWLGEVVTYNLLVLLSFPLTAFGTYLLAKRLWGSRAGALLAGLVAGFCAYRFVHAMGHLTLVTTEWIPFFFLYLEETIRKPSLKTGILVGIFYALSALATWTYAWFVALAAVLYLVVRVPWWGERRQLGPLVRSGLVAIVVALVPVVPFALPYVLATAGGAVISRPLEEAQAFSASVADFIIPSAFHPFWGQWVIRNWRSGDNGTWLSEWQVYVGFVALAMALVGIVAHRNRLSLALGIMAAGSFVIALGPSLYLTHPQPLNGVTARAALSPILLPVDALAQIPPFKFQRGWARMGFFVELAVGLLAAGGLAALLQALSRRYGSRARNLQWTMTLGVLSLAILDGLSIPIGMEDVSPRPVDTWLAQQAGQPIVMEYPMSNSYTGSEMYWTRQTGKRTIMGYASFPPNQAFWGELSRFPAPNSLDLLAGWGVRYVLVDETAYRAGVNFWGVQRNWDQIEPQILANRRLQEVTVRNGVHVYNLLDEPPHVLSTVELLSNPGFEAGAPKRPATWTVVGAPTYDRTSANAHTGNAAVAVTLRDNLVSRPVPIQSGVCYQLSAFSRSDEPTAMMRLQVNWQDAGGKDLGSATAGIEFIPVSSDWREERAFFRAPTGSSTARVYAVAQLGRVWLDDYSVRQVLDQCPPH